MSSREEAVNLFDGLHGVMVKGVKMTTAFGRCHEGEVGVKIPNTETEEMQLRVAVYHGQKWVDGKVSMKYKVGRMPKNNKKRNNFKSRAQGYSVKDHVQRKLNRIRKVDIKRTGGWSKLHGKEVKRRRQFTKKKAYFDPHAIFKGHNSNKTFYMDKGTWVRDEKG